MFGVLQLLCRFDAELTVSVFIPLNGIYRIRKDILRYNNILEREIHILRIYVCVCVYVCARACVHNLRISYVFITYINLLPLLSVVFHIHLSPIFSFIFTHFMATLTFNIQLPTLYNAPSNN